MKGATKMRMIALEKGLAISARKAGMAVTRIAEALHRDPESLKAFFKRQKVNKGGKSE